MPTPGHTAPGHQAGQSAAGRGRHSRGDGFSAIGQGIRPEKGRTGNDWHLHDMAPENAQSQSDVPAMVTGLGATLYEMLIWSRLQRANHAPCSRSSASASRPARREHNPKFSRPGNRLSQAMAAERRATLPDSGTCEQTCRVSRHPTDPVGERRRGPPGRWVPAKPGRGQPVGPGHQ